MQQENNLNVFKVLQELDAGVVNHTTWLKELHRSLVCGGEHSNTNDLRDDAHCHCDFGRWYLGVRHERLLKEPGFNAVGGIHADMHAAARDALLKKASQQTISPDEYDGFMDRAIQFKLEVRNLQYKLMHELCALDHLTGAWNRQTMLFKLNEEQERVARGGARCCICMVDIDHFKHINDTYGHGVGDEVLQNIIRLFNGKLRKYDSIYRYGGEEFLLCLPEASNDDAAAFMNRLCQQLESAVIATVDGVDIRVTASFGLACMSDDKSVDETILEADHALLCAKSKGRNRVCIWGETEQK